MAHPLTNGFGRHVEGSYDESGAPLMGAGNVADGFDPKWTPEFDLLSSSYASAPADSLDNNGNFINQLPRRSILAGTLESDHATTHVRLSPGLEVHVSNQDGGLFIRRLATDPSGRATKVIADEPAVQRTSRATNQPCNEPAVQIVKQFLNRHGTVLFDRVLFWAVSMPPAVDGAKKTPVCTSLYAILYAIPCS